MQINIKLSDNFTDYAKELRTRYFGSSATSNQYRDSFVFSQAIDRFEGDPKELLLDFVNSDRDLKNQKMLALKQNTYTKLEAISKTLGCTVASAFRAVICYTVQTKAPTSKNSYSDLEVKISLLEKQLADCQATLSQIKECLHNF